jgi:predicted DCC family thiol-disulfide oxidoreductase YuxK
MDIPTDKSILIFDGVCNLCNGSVNFVLRRDKAGRFAFASNQSEAGRTLLGRFGVDPDQVESVYLVEGDRIWSKSSATIAIAKRMPWPWRIGVVGAVIPRLVRDTIYDWIARNRYRWFGKSEACRLPTDAERDKFLA